MPQPAEATSTWEPESTAEVLRSRPLRVLARPWVERRFVHAAYERLLAGLADERRFVVVPLRDLAAAPTDRVAVGLRHDVDERLGSALELAALERRWGHRATYFVLHTARYYARVSWRCAERRESVLSRLARLQGLGHEVGWHNDLVTLQCVHGIEPRRYLEQELEWLRGSGIDVVGVARHGSYWARRLGYSNDWFFSDFDREGRSPGERTAVVVGDRRCELSKGRLADFGFEYDAYRMAEDAYFSDARFDPRGRRWHPDEIDLDRFRPGEKVIVLTHPESWDPAVARKALRTCSWAVYRTFTGERTRRPG
ncbi:MAG: hypothetical protein JOZ25_00530 [Actinobacteria bacterium]|nr:hypothetical protein [Actinomycetota bacterium]